MLTILTRAQHHRLVALSTVKACLGITGSEKDAKLLRMIEEASRTVAREVGCALARQEYRETFTGRGVHRASMSAWPIDTLTRLTCDGVEQVSATVANAALGHVALPEGFAWQPSHGGLAFDPLPGTEGLNYMAEFWAGYVLPEDVVEWSVVSAVEAGQWVHPGPGPVLFQAQISGTTGATDPAWPMDGVVSDGEVTWKAVGAFELPQALSDAVLHEVVDRYLTVDRDRGVEEREAEGARIKYRPTERPGGRLRTREAENLVRPYQREWVG